MRLMLVLILVSFIFTQGAPPSGNKGAKKSEGAAGGDNGFNKNNFNNNSNSTMQEIVNDGFDNNRNNWHVGNDKEYIAKFDSYEKFSWYSFERKIETGYHMSTNSFPFNNKNNFELKVGVQWMSGNDNNAFGMTFGYDDASNNINFVITANGYYMVYKYTNGNYQEIIPWKLSSAVKNEVQLNYLVVKKEGSTYKYYINDTYVDQSSVIDFMGDNFGFVVNSRQRITAFRASINGSPGKVTYTKSYSNTNASYSNTNSYKYEDYDNDDSFFTHFAIRFASYNSIQSSFNKGTILSPYSDWQEKSMFKLGVDLGMNLSLFNLNVGYDITQVKNGAFNSAVTQAHIPFTTKYYFWDDWFYLNAGGHYTMNIGTTETDNEPIAAHTKSTDSKENAKVFESGLSWLWGWGINFGEGIRFDVRYISDLHDLYTKEFGDKYGNYKMNYTQVAFEFDL